MVDALAVLQFLAYQLDKLTPQVEETFARLLSLESVEPYWKAKIRLSYIDFHRGEPEIWKKQLPMAQSEATRSGDVSLQIATLVLSAIRWMDVSELDKARELLSRARKLAEPVECLEQLAHNGSLQSVVFYQGYVELKARRIKAAQSFFLEALRLGGVDTRNRFKIRRLALEASLALGDQETGRALFLDGLDSVEALPTPGHQQSALWQVPVELIPLSEIQVSTILYTWLAPIPEASQSMVQEIRERPELRKTLESLIDADIARSLREKNAREVGEGYMTKSLYLDVLGRWSEAEQAALSGLEALTAVPGNNLDERKCNQCLMASRLAYLQGRPEQSLEYMLLAVQYAQNSHPSRYQGLSTIVGFRLIDLGRAKEALPFFEGVDWPQFAEWARLGQMRAQWALGQHQSSYRAANALYAEVAEQAPLGNQTLLSLATWAQQLGQTEEALEYYDRALQGAVEISLWSNALSLIGPYQRLLLQQGRPQEALEASLLALKPLLELQAILGDDLLEGEEFRKLVETTIALLAEEGKSAQAFQIVRRVSQAALLNTLELERLTTGDPEYDALVRKAQALRNQAARLTQKSRLSEEERAQVLAATRQELLLVLDRLREENPELEQLIALPAPELLALQDSLPPEVLLVEFFSGPQRLFVVAVGAGSVSKKEVQVSRRDLSELLARLQEQILRRAPESDATADRVSALLLEPIAKELASHQEVRVVPSGEFWSLPLSALKLKGRPLAQTHQISLSTSADLVRTLQLKTPRKWSGKPLLVGAPPGSNLPGAARELKALKALKARFPEAKLLLGEEATRERTLEQVEERDVIHFATHAYIDAEDGHRSRLSLAEGDLSVGEIYGLDLKSGSMAVLGACETAAGKARGPHLTSLATAFTSAGASTVVATRWPVDDQASEQFFGSFYNFLSQGASRGEALRKARLEFSQDVRWRDPIHWAAFCLIGDSR